MDGKASLGVADGQAGIEGGNLAKGGGCLLLEVVGAAVIGPKLVYEDRPRHELRGLVVFHEALLQKPELCRSFTCQVEAYSNLMSGKGLKPRQIRV